jgi:putative heme iron utilization protein
VAQQDNLTSAQQEFQNLRETLKTVQLATLNADGQPEASYAPFVWFEQNYYLYLSELARHTNNLLGNGSISLLFIESEESSRNLFARRRIILQGEAQAVTRDAELFEQIMAQFRQQFGKFIDLIQPLQDFHLFQIKIHSGRFVQGFAQAYELSGPGLNDIRHIGGASR